MAREANPNSRHSTPASKPGESAPCVSTPTSAKVTLAKVHFPKSEQVNSHSRPPLSLPQPLGWMALPSAAGARPALQTLLVSCKGTHEHPSQPAQRGVAEGLGTVQHKRLSRVFSPSLSPSLLISRATYDSML